MSIKYFRTKRQAQTAKNKVGYPGVALMATSKEWKTSDKRRKGKNYVIKY